MNELANVEALNETDYCRFHSVLQLPFQKGFEPEGFYPGAGRLMVLEDLLAQVHENRNVFIRAERGSGRTAMCRMIQDKLPNAMCLYVNGSNKGRQSGLLQQLGDHLLLGEVNSSVSYQSPKELSERLSQFDQVVICVEGLSSLTRTEIAHLWSLQQVSKVRNNISIVFFYSRIEESKFTASSFDIVGEPLELLALSAYEVYEYLNYHMSQCGCHAGFLFSREVSSLIAEESEGVFEPLILLAGTILKRAYKRRVHRPAIMDVPVCKNKQLAVVSDKKKESSVSALLTVRNTLLIGSLTGGIVLMLIWSIMMNQPSGSGLSGLNVISLSTDL